MKRVLALVVGCTLLAGPAFAADVDGKWTGTVEAPMGAIPVGFTFKADGVLVVSPSQREIRCGIYAVLTASR